MKRFVQRLTVGVVMRVVHAAICELRAVGDTRAVRELSQLREGMAYSVSSGAGGPELHVQWKDGRLLRRLEAAEDACRLRIKTLPLAFRLFTGRLGLAQAYAWHAFTIQGDVADVMRLARLVNLVEAYLFPRFITRRILTDIPEPQANPLRIYGRLCLGFLTGRYAHADSLSRR